MPAAACWAIPSSHSGISRSHTSTSRVLINASLSCRVYASAGDRDGKGHRARGPPLCEAVAVYLQPMDIPVTEQRVAQTHWPVPFDRISIGSFWPHTLDVVWL